MQILLINSLSCQELRLTHTTINIKMNIFLAHGPKCSIKLENGLSHHTGKSFSGGGDRGNARKLFPTIASQLAVANPQLIPDLQRAVCYNPSIVTKAMQEQFEKLILKPLQNLEQSDVSVQTMIIVLNALDECEGDSDIRLILQLLPRLQNIAAIRLQADLSIRLRFSKIASDDYEDLVLHDVPLELIEHDISLFFDHRLTHIRTVRYLPIKWLGERDRKLIALSVPLFIFPATICRVFEEPDWDPIDSLNQILMHHRSKLEGTYLPILDRLLSKQNDNQKAKLISEFQQVIGTLVILESPLSINSLSKLLGLHKGLIYLRLSPLHSVLRVPDDELIPIRLFHQSFRDFLLDPETRKKTPLGISEIDRNAQYVDQKMLLHMPKPTGKYMSTAK
ncbi:hypothetical protein N7489_008008 [Penicillium chrysogenum]|uniref:Nephrocystin 3-like N-terminal domain-containing protein n=1 Tax=Penicillium chrysogenum TaxID=5076 RepID=A0ABQ8WDD0_PENCH|nr:uncharacterized protein N7489_008008 [Penicillium chrysogenum]KAJ5237917.1 hypothetical protein N7489_008008 [Penicillium chrysogenum]KAJ5261822.1 hypothetical protein N7505_008689 [Penicillium chrysogenum]